MGVCASVAGKAPDDRTFKKEALASAKTAAISPPEPQLHEKPFRILAYKLMKLSPSSGMLSLRVSSSIDALDSTAPGIQRLLAGLNKCSSRSAMWNMWKRGVF